MHHLEEENNGDGTIVSTHRASCPPLFLSLSVCTAYWEYCYVCDFLQRSFVRCVCAICVLSC